MEGKARRRQEQQKPNGSHGSDKQVDCCGGKDRSCRFGEAKGEAKWEANKSMSHHDDAKEISNAKNATRPLSHSRVPIVALTSIASF